MQQLQLIPRAPLFHGGEIQRGRKNARTLCCKRPIHFVLKAKKRILYKNKSLITQEIENLAQGFNLRVYGIALNFDHAHFALKISNRKNYRAFIRALTGILARKLGKGLWALLPFSRVVQWGRDFRNLMQYFRKNREETRGSRPYEKRKDWYRRFKKPS